MADRPRIAAEENARRHLKHLDELTLAVCHLRDRTYTRRRFLEEAARIADWYNTDRFNERQRAADRHRVTVWRFPARVPADRCFKGPWFVGTPAAETIYSTHPTHAEAITAAHKLAHDTAPRVWTTPDSGTQADYSLATGSA